MPPTSAAPACAPFDSKRRPLIPICVATLCLVIGLGCGSADAPPDPAGSTDRPTPGENLTPANSLASQQGDRSNRAQAPEGDRPTVADSGDPNMDDPREGIDAASLNDPEQAPLERDELVRLVQLHNGDVERALADVAERMGRDRDGNLIQLWLRPRVVTDAGCRHLGRLNSLLALDLLENPVGNAGLAEIAGLTHLQALGLGGTKVTDEGLALLANFPRLSELNLESTAITDAAIPHLQKLRALRTLSVDDTQMTGAGISQLRRELPLCDIPR